MTRRRRARIVALEVLYAVEHGSGQWSAVLTEVATKAKLDAEALAFAKRLVRTTLSREKEIDRLLASSSDKWAVRRMAAVDRNILRLGVTQIAHMHDIPPKVAIDESVELAKSYGGPDSPAFVNGVLDRVARTARESLEREAPFDSAQDRRNPKLETRNKSE